MSPFSPSVGSTVSYRLDEDEALAAGLPSGTVVQLPVSDLTINLHGPGRPGVHGSMELGGGELTVDGAAPGDGPGEWGPPMEGAKHVCTPAEIANGDCKR